MTAKKFNSYLWAFWIYTLAGILLIFLPFGLPILILGVTYGAMFLYQCWKLIPADIARTTPAKAVGYSFIPFFNLYWFLVAFYGLGKDMNETLRRNRIAYRVNEGLGLAYCILVVAMCASFLIWVCCVIHDEYTRPYHNDVVRDICDTLAVGSIIVFCAAAISFLIVGVFFLKSVKNGAIVILEPERANQMQSEKETALNQRGPVVFTQGTQKVMGGLTAAKDAVQARIKLNTLNTQLVAAYRSLGDAAEQAGWDDVLCKSIGKQREEIAALAAQQEKAAADVELAQNTPGAGIAKQALKEAKKRTVFATGILDGLREKAGRKLFDDVSVPADIGTEQRIEITRLREEVAECERVIAHGKTSLMTKPVLVTASVLVLLVVGALGFALFSQSSGGRNAPTHERRAGQTAKQVRFSASEQAEIDEFLDMLDDSSININTDINRAIFKKGRTLLHTVSGTGEIVIAKFLVSKGANVNIRDDEGFTPLHLAAITGHVEVARLLVSNGANVNARSDDDSTPLDCAETIDAFGDYTDNKLGKRNPAMIRFLTSVGGVK